MTGKGLQRIFLTALVLVITVNRLVKGQLTQVSSCTCPGDTVVYTCSVTGTGFTIWKGSAFYCPGLGSQIFLSHSSFRDAGVSGSCNDGALFGRSIGVNGTTYTSQLMVNLTANSSVIGQRIECVHLNPNGIDSNMIGSSLIQLAEPLPPPSDITLVNVSQTQLTFNWRPAESNCPSVEYGLQSDCGACINDSTSTQTSKTCAIKPSATIETRCSFAVQTIICGNVSGILSDRINLTLKVPEPPPTSSIHVFPYYNASDQKLLVLNITFDELDEFFISDGVSGSVLSYTITYTTSDTNSDTSILCDTLTIYPNQSCSQGKCAIPSLNPVPCSQTMRNGIIDVAVLATNVLGNGPASIVHADFINKFVDVTFESDTRIVCTFLQQSSSKSCSIEYGECGQELSPEHRQGHMNSSNTRMVIIELSLDEVQSSRYCYTISASNDNTRVFVKGTRIRGSFSNGSLGGQNVAAITVGVILGVAFLILLIAAGAVIILLIVKYLSHTKKYKATESERASLISSRVGSIRSLSPKEVFAHIKFDVEDKPQELLKALKKLRDEDINIKNIRSGPCSASTEIDVCLKTIYIECESNLTADNRAALQRMGLGREGSLVVCYKAKKYEVDDYEDFDSSNVKIEVQECLKHQPGALVELLEFIYSLENWQSINLTDIEISLTKSSDEGPEQHKNISLKFQSDVARDWKVRFDQEKYKCSAIAHLKQSTSV